MTGKPWPAIQYTFYLVVLQVHVIINPLLGSDRLKYIAYKLFKYGK